MSALEWRLSLEVGSMVRGTFQGAAPSSETWRQLVSRIRGSSHFWLCGLASSFWSATWPAVDHTHFTSVRSRERLMASLYMDMKAVILFFYSQELRIAARQIWVLVQAVLTPYLQPCDLVR